MNKPNPKGNIFVAAFTTAHARLHLLKAVKRLGPRVLYMDTDSVVFNHTPGQWIPEISSFLGDWTDEVAQGSRIVDFTTCGPKNYCYTTVDSSGATKSIMKVKGLRLTSQAKEMLTGDVMRDQVESFATRRRPGGAEPPAAKRPCLATAQRKAAVSQTRLLNETYLQQGAPACMELRQADGTEDGPCNCGTCRLKTSVTVPQGQFRKFRREGFVQTADIRKEYQLVLNKRWLLQSYGGRELPLAFKTLPFGFVEPEDL